MASLADLIKYIPGYGNKFGGQPKQPTGGVMGQPGFGNTPQYNLPPQLAGTGGVKSPAGPYGPPGFVPGLPQTGGLEPNPANKWAGTPKPGTPEWLTSPQGMAQYAKTVSTVNPMTGLVMGMGKALTPGVNPRNNAPIYTPEQLNTVTSTPRAGAGYQSKSWLDHQLDSAGINYSNLNDAQKWVELAKTGAISPGELQARINDLKFKQASYQYPTGSQGGPDWNQYMIDEFGKIIAQNQGGGA